MESKYGTTYNAYLVTGGEKTALIEAVHRDYFDELVRNVERRHMRFRLRVAKSDQHLAVWLHALLPPRLNGRILNAYYGGNKQGASRGA